MNVRMPDGTIIQNVPEGTTQADLQSRLSAYRAPAPVPQAAAPKPEPDSVLSRIGTGLADPLYGVAQIADKALVNPIRQMISPGATSMEDVIRQRDAEYHAPEGIDVARIVGNVINPVNYLAPEAGIATKAMQAAGPVGRAALAGAAQSALAPVNPDDDFLIEKAKQMGIGGASGAVLAKMLPRVLKLQAVKPTEEAARLQAAGIDLTPGQAGGGAWNAVEQKLTSVPGVGDIIASARNRAIKDVERKAIERTGVGPEAAKSIDTARDAISEMYQGVVPKLKPTGEATVDVLGAVAKAADNPELTKANREILEGIHDKLFGAKGERYMQLSGDTLKDVDTELGALGRKYEKSVLPSDQTLGEEIRNIQQAMRKAWRYHLDPADAAKLDAANTAHARMLPIESAASQRADEVVMPRALQKALAKQANVEPVRLKDELVRDAVKTLSSTAPDSGTAGRLAIPKALVGLATGVAAPIPVVGGLAATAAAYTRTGVNALTGNTAAQRWLSSQAPTVRKALIAAMREHEAAHNQE
jgi:hypothetical protein